MKRHRLIVMLSLCAVLLSAFGVFQVHQQTARAAVPHMTRLTVTRPAVSYGGGFPGFTTTISDATANQNLYAAALALPFVPSNSTGLGLFCPVSEGIIYYLTFFDGSRVVSQMDVQADGCRLILIHHEPRTRYTNLAFDALAAKTFGLSSLLPY